MADQCWDQWCMGEDMVNWCCKQQSGSEAIEDWQCQQQCRDEAMVDRCYQQYSNGTLAGIVWKTQYVLVECTKWSTLQCLYSLVYSLVDHTKVDWRCRQYCKGEAMVDLSYQQQSGSDT